RRRRAGRADRRRHRAERHGCLQRRQAPDLPRVVGRGGRTDLDGATAHLLRLPDRGERPLVLTVRGMRRYGGIIGVLFASVLLFGVLGGPLGTSALPMATLAGGTQDGPVGTVVTVNLTGFSQTAPPTA